MNVEVYIREALFARSTRKIQQRMRCAVRRCVLQIEMKVLDAAKVANRRCARAIVNGERVARTVCSRATRNRAADRGVAEVDDIVVRDRASTARDTARDGRVAEVDDIVVRDRAIAADNLIDRYAAKTYGVVRCSAACDIGIAAVDRAADRSRAVHCDVVALAVAKLVRRSRRACARRPAAVHIRMCAGVNRKDIARRRVARNGAAAPCVSADGRRRRCALEGVGIADNPSVPVANIEIRFLRPVCIQFGLEHVAAREGQRVRTLDEGRFVRRRIKTSLKGIEVECSRIRQRQFGILVLERYLREVLDLADGRCRVDVQRIAVRRAVAAGDCASDRAARKRDGIVCLLYTSPSPRDGLLSRMPSSA